ncbi:DUF4352 domain-containing protein [Nocardia sp. NPDC059246]|uniref:DUF4352 domain-containing protein n=1 Tax=unclassified Nocardia TaxID=2637762 RepID=UPI00368C067A
MTYPPPPQGPQQPYYQPGYPVQPYPMQPPPKKSSKWLWIVLATFILACGGCSGLLAVAGNSGDKSKAGSTTAAAVQPAGAPAASSAPAATSAPAKPKSNIAPAGTAVRDGQFEFVVTQFTQGDKELGSGMSHVTAQGEFALVHIKVTNTGKAQRTYDADNQKVLDDQGREFGPTTSAFDPIPNNGNSFGDDLNPGFTVERVIVFDVPVGTILTTAVLHDSMFSGGAKAALR